MSSSFVHLHQHTSYSQLDGHSKPNEMVAAAVADGQPAIASTDHGNVHGLIDMYKECAKQGIKYIPGQEFYFADDRLLREKVKVSNNTDKLYYHLTILAENNEGYHNLIKLSSDAFLEGMYYRPRTDWATLESHSKGIIATSGCLGGPVCQKLLQDDVQGAQEAAARLQDIYGRDNFFIEIMNHGLPEQNKINPYLIQIAKNLNAPIVATNDGHYTKHSDAPKHAVLLCCQTHTTLDDPKRFKFDSDQHYLKTAEEMRYTFRDVKDACDNTLWIAERSNVEIDFDTLHLPDFPIPEGWDNADDYLRHLATRGMLEKYPNAGAVEHDRLNYELAMMAQMGLSSYFLIFDDLIKFMKRENIMYGPGRGSSSGSIVCYNLDITKVDPIKYGLIFERFINPSRIALADIDIDIESGRREEVIAYTVETYGQENVAQIITFSTIKARSAVRDAAKVLGLPYDVGNNLSKALPEPVMGFTASLADCMQPDSKDGQDLRDMYASNHDYKEVIDAAIGLEGLVRHDGVHAAGVIIGDRPLNELIPLQRRKNGKELGPVTSQYEKNTIEDLGLLKMDFLALKNLDVMAGCLIRVGRTNEALGRIPMEDPETFQLLREGRGIGVFQVESLPMRQLLIRMQPTCIEDISAVLALYRPGPMAMNMHNDYADIKNGRKPESYFHPDARKILSGTHSICLYQEQVMEISREFAGYTMAEADNLRKIMGKKLPEKMAAEKEKFVSGCDSNGYGAISEELFHLIEGFAAYGFAKSHAMAYAFITYWTAYLKAHYPREYMASLCTEFMSDLDKTAVYLNEVRSMGFKVHLPDINLSQSGYSVEDDGIRIGLGAVKNIGLGLSERIVELRSEPFEGLFDFCSRTGVNITATRSLADAGALGDFGTRAGTFIAAEEVLDAVRSNKVSAEQESLFGNNYGREFHIPEHEHGRETLLTKEKDVLGLYVSGHPLEDYVGDSTGVMISDIREMDKSEKPKNILAIITGVTKRTTKAGKKMANLVVSDATGELSCVIFPRTLASTESYLGEGNVVKLSMKTGDGFNDRKDYICMGVSLINEKRSSGDIPIGEQASYMLPAKFNFDKQYMGRLKGLCLEHSGNKLLKVWASRTTAVDLNNDYFVSGDEKMNEAFAKLFREFGELGG